MIEVILIMIFLLLFGFLLGGFMGAPWVPTVKKDIDKILDDFGSLEGEKFVELGCGDGRMLKAAAKRGANAIGYEINPTMWLIAFTRNINVPNSKVKLRNIWSVDVSNADQVFAFLMPKFMTKLETKLNKEFKKGATFISYIFPLPSKKAKTIRKKWLIYEYE